MNADRFAAAIEVIPKDLPLGRVYATLSILERRTRVFLEGEIIGAAHGVSRLVDGRRRAAEAARIYESAFRSSWPSWASRWQPRRPFDWQEKGIR